jgi:hypothetical protein
VGICGNWRTPWQRKLIAAYSIHVSARLDGLTSKKATEVFNLIYIKLRKEMAYTLLNGIVA